MLRWTLAIVVIAAVCSPIFAEINPDLLAGMKARAIGPTGMSGRIASITAVESQPDIIYVGAATGGVWKSTNRGITWTAIFEDQPVAAIGAVEVFQPDPDIVWVGTGEGNPRNSASVGNGVYKSMDGGKKWIHLGLDKTERINRVVLHPSNPNVAYVAAMGQEWGENPDRGVFKTEDGGKTWKKVLYVNERVGAADLIMDPSNPQKLYAAMWEYRRWPWFFKSGGPYSGLYVTNDGGENWTKLTEEDGLPKGDLGRIGLAISHSHPQIVYALVEADKSALVRSTDSGKTWTKINENYDVNSRPFYFCDIRVDPELPDRLYDLATTIRVSDDAGKNFSLLGTFRDIHPDFHAMWINPNDATHMLVGNDGGVYISDDRGKSWRFVANLPLAQYYHINVDMDTPYNIYGGMQDNGSWRGPSQVWENGGIQLQHWDEVGFGDGFDVMPDPKDSMIGYSMSQEGFLIRWNLHTGQRKDIRPWGPEGTKLRFNWNAGFSMDPFDGNTIYYGSQFLHKSMDRGETWTMISPDLTSNNPEWQKQEESGGITIDASGAENYTTIIAIAPSPVKKDQIWVGTDDGRLQLTRDGGKTWTSLEKNVKGVPANTWIPQIHASRSDPATAFVMFDDHRRSNWNTYAFRTTDFGATWQNLATKDVRGYALSLEQDTVNPNLLFLGTEFGLYVSLNGAKSWFRWKYGFPTVSTMDLMIHPREQDLVIATHGRAAYILDDIRPLRTLSEATMSEPIHLFGPADAQGYTVKQFGAARFPGSSSFRGENRPFGALITFSLNMEGLPLPDPEQEKERKEKERQEKLAKPAAAAATEPKKEDQPPSDMAGKEEEEKGPQAEIKISDASGKVIRTFKSPVKMGVNRAVWDLRADTFKAPPREEPRFFGNDSGPEVLPGTYGVIVSYKDKETKGTIKVLADPRTTISDQDRKAKWDAIQQAGHLQESATAAIQRIMKTRSDVDFILQRANKLDQDEKKDSGAKESSYKGLIAAAGKMKKDLTDLEKKLWNPPKTKGLLPDNKPWSAIDYVNNSLDSSWDAPTGAQMEYMKQAEHMLSPVLKEVNDFYDQRLPEFKKLVDDKKIMLLDPGEPVKMK